MADTTNEPAPDEAPQAGGPTPAVDDSRFEVKWKKKGSAAAGTPTPAPPPAPEGDVADLRRELEEAQARIRDLQDRWQRSAADLANLRKRTEQERSEHEKFANLLLVAEMLPVLDNFERALTTIPGNLAMLTWIQGIMLIERHFQAILEHQGLAEIEAEGKPFNPALHEAIGEVESADLAPGMVARVYQKGYTMHGRVVRPTLVEISRAPARPAPAPESEAATETTTAEAAEIARDAESENAGP
ncbi:MAG TPA: nucleotide exchange factor GrpE [Chloroflexota bacterium]|nr:nucleotide exchange factor GrpE [Chloroflexota bacterium]